MFLAELSDSKLKALVDYVENVIQFNYAFRTLTARVTDYEWEIDHHGRKMSRYAMISPDICIVSDGYVHKTVF